MKHFIVCFFFGISNLSFSISAEVITDSSLAQEGVTNLVLAIRLQPQSEKEFAAKEQAIKQSAKIKNPDAEIIEALFDNYSYISRDVPLNIMRAPNFSLKPARDALLIIGGPVVPKLIERLKTLDDPKLRFSYVSLLREIVGKDHAVELLNKAAVDLAEQKSRLDKSLGLLQ